MRACPNAPDSSVSIGCEVVTRLDDSLSCTGRVSFVHIPLQAESPRRVSCFWAHGEGGIGEWPVSDAIICTSAVATKTCVWIQDG